MDSFPHHPVNTYLVFAFLKSQIQDLIAKPDHDLMEPTE